MLLADAEGLLQLHLWTESKLTLLPVLHLSCSQATSVLGGFLLTSAWCLKAGVYSTPNKSSSLPPCGILALRCVMLVLEWCWGSYVWEVNVLWGICRRTWPSCPGCWLQVALFICSRDIKLFSLNLVFCPDKQLFSPSLLIDASFQRNPHLGGQSKEVGGVLKLLSKANICHRYIFHMLRLFITLFCRQYWCPTVCLWGDKIPGRWEGFSVLRPCFIMSRRQPKCGLLPKAGFFPGSCLSVCLAAGLPWLKLLKLMVKPQPKSLVVLEAQDISGWCLENAKNTLDVSGQFLMEFCRATLVRFHQEGAQCSFSVSSSKTSFPKMFCCNKPYKACFQVFLREAPELAVLSSW